MILVHSRSDLQRALAELSRPVGLVPTMGALHAGHASLIHRSAAENPTTVVWIFVNPTQFGPTEDFSRYPRSLPADCDLAEAAGATIVLAPSVEEVYPAGFATFVSINGLADRWEGEIRPGHFDGVATVVARLLGLVGADTAYFGEKDYQQLQIVRRLVADLALSTAIVGCPTVREPDGLALSSRNAYLSTEERRQAVALSQALFQGRQLVRDGMRDVASIEAMMEMTVLMGGLIIDYLRIVDPATLEPKETIDGPARAIGAVRCGGVRLIDNVAIG